MDERLEGILKLSQTARNFCTEFLTAHGRRATSLTLNELFFVPLLILSRAIRHHDAIELLLRSGFTAEASIIGLTQFELCLDILYIGDNISRATRWMNHTSTRSSPWRVKDKIDSIWATNPEVREINHRCFELLSSVKHGNPTAGVFAFPARRTGDRLTVTNDQLDDAFTRTYALIVGGFCSYQLIESVGGASRAFGRFVAIDPNLEARREQLVQECRREIGKAMHAAGLVKSEKLD